MALQLLIFFVFSVFHCSSGIPLDQFFPFGEEAGDTLVDRTLDGSSAAITLPSPFPFFDNSNGTVFVSLKLINFDDSCSIV